MRLIIAGSRTFDDYELLKEKTIEFIGKEQDVTIISGLARGADSLACDFAAEMGYPLEGFAAEWKKNGYYDPGAGFKRNKYMAKNADSLLAFWDRKSTGTLHMIDYASSQGLNVEVVEYVG